jgi:valyl-tRNA synthetase
LFVNPTDERYKKLIGHEVINPINDAKIKVLADEYIETTFGTGIMKCTPAHDFNDYNLGKKYKLKKINIFNEDGTLNSSCNTKLIKLSGKDRIAARKPVIEFLESINAIEKIEDYVSNIGYSERTNEIVEPFLSKQ